MKKATFVFAFLLIISTGIKAQDNITSQDYRTALGVKFYPGAVTLKHFINDRHALEALGYIYNHGTRVTGLFEFHFDIPNAPGLKWYVGPGAHIGFYNEKHRHWDGDRHDGALAIGVDGVIGLDYKFKGAPINLSVDWQPSFEFGDTYGRGFSGNWGGFAIRYVF